MAAAKDSPTSAPEPTLDGEEQACLSGDAYLALALVYDALMRERCADSVWPDDHPGADSRLVTQCEERPCGDWIVRVKFLDNHYELEIGGDTVRVVADGDARLDIAADPSVALACAARDPARSPG